LRRSSGSTQAGTGADGAFHQDVGLLCAAGRHLIARLSVSFSGLRIVSYMPQIWRVARDRNGASAISSYVTWSLWTGANLTTALYAFVNLGDLYLALVSLVYAACCTAVIALTVLKRQGLASSARTVAASLRSERAG
jgi:hypothetical protein